MTPVTETYIHSGHVQRAIFLCEFKALFPRGGQSVIKIIGTITIAKIVCEIKIVR